MTGAPNRVRIGSLRLAGVCALGLGLAPALAFAQYAPPPPEPPKVIDLGSVTDPPPDLLDGTLSGLGDELDNENTEENGSSWLRFASPMQPWLDFKQNVLLQQYGLMIGGSEGILGQDFSNSLTNNHSAVGQKFTMNVGQQLLWKGTPEALWIEMVVEDRSPVGTEFAPLQAGLRTGSSTATAPTWGDFNLGVTQLYLRQNLFDNHFQYTFGKIFAPNYVNPYPLFDDNRQYLNQIFTTSVTIPVPLRGFGAVAAWFPTDYGLYAKGGIYTVYSDDTGFTADSFFNRPEYFRHLELGWSGIAANGTPIQARGPMDANNFSVTLWDKDAEQNGPPAAHGVAFNANYLIQPNLMLFGRGGWSEGWQLDRNLSFGAAWRPTQEYSDMLGVGGGWAQPANPNLRDQYIFETFYRFQLTTQLAITPDVQWILHPTLNPNAGSVWVASLRMRLTF
jgi:porin